MAENVSGMLARRHHEAVQNIITSFKEAGYSVFIKMLDAYDFETAQNRKRVFYVGFRHDLMIDDFDFPQPIEHKISLKDVIWDLKDSAVPALENIEPMVKTVLFLIMSTLLVVILAFI